MKRFWFAALGVMAAAGVLGAQAPAQAPSRPDQQDQRFRVQIQLVTTDAIVRDAKGLFVSDLSKNDFEVYEDGVKQDLSSMTVVHGGRVTNLLAPPPPVIEGVILPARRVQNDTSGRIFLFVVDDFHLDVHKTPVIRDLFKRIGKNLLHEGDLFGMISTGTSAISIDLTYDRKRFDEAVNQITGRGLSPDDIIQGQQGAEGPIEVRYRAQVAFTTVNTVLANLEKVHDRRKIIVYVSNGYDFTPFILARSGTDTASNFTQSGNQRLMNRDTQQAALAEGKQSPRQDPNAVGNILEEFGDAALVRELQNLTETANRANATIYTIDPRGVVAGADASGNLNPQEYQNYVSKSQDTLRVIAAETGGIAIVNQNDFDSALKRIDAEASDYYMLGYYAKNADPRRREHHIEIKVNRPGLTVVSRKTYVEKVADAAPVPASPAPPAPRR